MTETASTSTDWLELAKFLTQLSFWVIIGTLAVLTYRRARKTLLQPIRTEIFKAQFQELTKILGLFVGKGEVELRSMFSFSEFLHANFCAMLDNYSYTFFDIRPERDDRPYASRHCPTGMVFEPASGPGYLRLADGHITDDQADKSASTERDPRVRAAQWNDYSHPQLYLPRAGSDMESHIQSFLENPLLPARSIELLQEYLSMVMDNRHLLREILIEAAKEMPDKYPSLDELQRASDNWINHRYVERFKHLRPKASEIVSFVRSYYEADHLIDT